MNRSNEKSKLPKRIILHAIKLPLVFFVIGLLFTNLSLFQSLPVFSDWIITFNFINKFGNVFITIGFLIFFYKLCIYLILYYETTTKDKDIIIIIHTIRNNSWIIFTLITLSILVTIFSPYKLVNDYANNIITIGIILTISWILIKILTTTEYILYQKMKDLVYEKRFHIYSLYTKVHILRNVGIVLISVITFAAILMTFNNVRSIGISLLASAGMITAIVGISGQKTFTALFSGLQIAITQPIKIGDMLFMDNDWGIVEEINFTFVILKMRDNRKLIVPINYFVENKFQNWTRSENSITTSIHIKVDYMTPINEVRKKLTEILENSQYWDGNANKLMVFKIEDAYLDLRVQISTTDPYQLSNFKAEVREKLILFMQENYPQYLATTRQIAVTQGNESIPDKKNENEI